MTTKTPPPNSIQQMGKDGPEWVSPPFPAPSGDQRGRLTRAQIQRLLKPVRQDNIEKKQGMTYVPQHEVRAELMRIFGPGNVDHTMHSLEMQYETMLEKGHPQFPTNGKAPVYWVTGYRGGCTLRVRDYYGREVAELTEYHFEENAPLPNRGEAHAMAITSVQSYALRRAAISLGDAFGLHLYDGGSAAPFVKGTLALQGDPDSPLYTPPQERQNAAGGDGNIGTAPEGQSGTQTAQAGAQPRGAAYQDGFKTGAPAE